MNRLNLSYRSELSLSKRSRELVDAAPGDVLKKLSAPFTDSDSDVLESIQRINQYYCLHIWEKKFLIVI